MILRHTWFLQRPTVCTINHTSYSEDWYLPFRSSRGNTVWDGAEEEERVRPPFPDSIAVVRLSLLQFALLKRNEKPKTASRERNILNFVAEFENATLCQRNTKHLMKGLLSRLYLAFIHLFNKERSYIYIYGFNSPVRFWIVAELESRKRRLKVRLAFLF